MLSLDLPAFRCYNTPSHSFEFKKHDEGVIVVVKDLFSGKISIHTPNLLTPLTKIAISTPNYSAKKVVKYLLDHSFIPIFKENEVRFQHSVLDEDLEQLSLTGPKNFSEKWGEQLSQFKKLRTLSLKLYESTDSLQSICKEIAKHLPKLENFSIQNNGNSIHQIDFRVLKEICKLTSLKVLDIRKASFDSEFVKSDDLGIIIPDLSLLENLTSLKKLLVPSCWFYQKPRNKKILGILIKNGVDVQFGDNTSKNLAMGRGVLWSKSYPEYWAPSRQGLKWWEKVYFHREIANTSREALIEKVKVHLAKNQINFNEWEKFIEMAENFQLAALLHKDAYYLGKLDEDAGIYYDPDKDCGGGVHTPTNPSKVKQLVMHACFTELFNRYYMSARSLVLKGDTDFHNLRSLQHYIHLENLEFTSLLEESSFEGLPILPKLKSLSLCNGKLTTDNFKTICLMPNLESLKLENTILEDVADLDYLANLKNLKYLEIPLKWVEKKNVTDLVKSENISQEISEDRSNDFESFEDSISEEVTDLNVYEIPNDHNLDTVMTFNEEAEQIDKTGILKICTIS